MEGLHGHLLVVVGLVACVKGRLNYLRLDLNYKKTAAKATVFLCAKYNTTQLKTASINQ